jgi:hypothetical protein
MALWFKALWLLHHGWKGVVDATGDWLDLLTVLTLQYGRALNPTEVISHTLAARLDEEKRAKGVAI